MRLDKIENQNQGGRDYMGFAPIGFFRTKDEALKFIEESEDKERLFVFYERDMNKEAPWVVNID